MKSYTPLIIIRSLLNMSGYDTLNFGYVSAEDSEVASFLRNTQGLVNIRDSSLAPSSGDVLIATSSTEASWAPIPPNPGPLSSVLALGNTTGANNIVVQQQLQLPIGVATGSTNLLNVTSGAGVPTSAGVREGSLYYDTTGNALYVYDAVSGWISTTGGGGPTPTLSQVLTAGNVAGALQRIEFNSGTKISQVGLLDTNDNTVLSIKTALPGTRVGIQLENGAAEATIKALDQLIPANTVDLDLAPSNNGDINLLTSPTAQTHTTSFFSSGKQTRAGLANLTVLSVPAPLFPDVTQVVTGGTTTWVRFGRVSFDDNVDGLTYANTTTDRIEIPAGQSTWMVTMNLAFRENAIHGNAVLRIRLNSYDGTDDTVLAVDQNVWMPFQEFGSSNLSCIHSVGNTNYSHLWVEFQNTSSDIVITTARLHAVRIN